MLDIKKMLRKSGKAFLKMGKLIVTRFTVQRVEQIGPNGIVADNFAATSSSDTFAL